MSVISQKITGKNTFTAPSDCVVSLRGSIFADGMGAPFNYLTINNSKIIGSKEDGVYFEYNGVVLKKGDTISFFRESETSSVHISGFTIEG